MTATPPTSIETHSGTPAWLMPGLWVALGLYMLGVVAVATMEVRQRSVTVGEAIDRSLRAGALVVPRLLGPDFHDRAVDATAISRAEDEGNILRLSKHASEAGFAYLYAVVLDSAGQLRLTASSATETELSHLQAEDRFWSLYDDAPPELQLTLADGQPRFAEYTDRWGTFRSVFLRQYATGGRPFLVGADYNLTTVNQQLHVATVGAIVAGIFQGIFGLSIVLVVRWVVRRLQRSQHGLHLLSLAARSSDHGVVIGGADQRVLWSNEAFQLQAGVAGETLLGRPLRDLLGLPEDTQTRQRIAGALDGNVAVSVECVASGGRWIQSALQPVPGTGGGVGNWIVMTSDLSRRKTMEDALLRARIAAEAANEAKSSFLANMSHEIRTPMNGIMGMTELLLGSKLGDEQRTYARTVYSSAESLLMLLNDILDLSKIEAGHMSLDPHPTDLAALIHDVIAIIRPRLQGTPVEVLVRIAPGSKTTVLVDPLRIRQILSNLLGNAVKFTRQGHILIELSSAPTAQPEVLQVALQVADTGCGIPADRVSHLFQPFIQADASTARHFGGTGLGLAISRRLARLMGGDISLASTLGQGSTFTVALALPPVDITASAIRPSLQILENVAVLVVDDNEVNLRILGEILTACGARPVLVPGAGEALLELAQAAAAGTPFPLMITDLRMPGMDGTELAAQVRDDPETGQPAVVLYTSEPSSISRTNAAASGCAGFLVKPTQPEKILGVLAAIMQSGAQAKMLTIHSLSPASEDTVSIVRRRPLSVLLAEDNTVNQQVAVALLERLGCTVEVAGDGEAAVAAAQRGGHDLVFMDCMMPGTDGYQATMAIRAAAPAGGRRLPIIAMTAGALAGDRERCIAAGMDDFVAKPIRGKELESMLERWVPTS